MSAENVFRPKDITCQNPPFFCASFFPCFGPCPPHPFPANFLPPNPSFWDLRSTLSSREKATCRGWVLGTILDGVAPQEKKENPFFFFSGLRKKVRKAQSFHPRSQSASSLTGAYARCSRAWLKSLTSLAPESKAGTASHMYMDVRYRGAY